MSVETASPSSAEILREAGFETPEPQAQEAAPAAAPEPAAAQESVAPDNVQVPAVSSSPDEPAAANPATPAPPAPAPWKRKFNLKVYGQAKEVEADEERVTKALQLLEAEKDVRFSEQLAGAKWAVAQARKAGHDVELAQDPTTGDWGMKWKTPNTTAPTTPATEAPPETTDDDLLKQAAAEYGAESVAYKLFERNVRSLAAERKLREQRDEEARQTTARQRQVAEDERTRQAADQFFQTRAKAFEGERGSRASTVTRLALYALENLAPAQFAATARSFGLASNGSLATRREEVLRIGGMFADDREQEWGERLRAAIPATAKPAPPPPPVVGTGSSAPAQPSKSTLRLGDPNHDEKFAEELLSRSAAD